MCCGKTSSQPSGSASRTPAGRPPAPAASKGLTKGSRIEYIGRTALTVVSPLTGKRYRFPAPGASLEVDVRDQSWITFVPQLRVSHKTTGSV
jgi:hypothetical protein